MDDKTVDHISWTKSACKSRKLKSTSFSTWDNIRDLLNFHIHTRERCGRFSMEKALILHKRMWQWVTVRKKAEDLWAWPRRPVLLSCNPKSLCFTLILWPVYMTHFLSFKRDINRAENKTITVTNMLNIKEKLKSTDFLSGDWVLPIILEIKIKNKKQTKRKQETLFLPG